jgi:type 1 fimbria pilin
MTGPFFSFSLVGCALALSLVASNAKAAGGRIAFSGAVVTPTCVVVPAGGIQAGGAAASPFGVDCPGSAPAGAAKPAYVVTVSKLTAAEPDRVLGYFSDYVAASQATAQRPMLVTQVYE